MYGSFTLTIWCLPLVRESAIASSPAEGTGVRVGLFLFLLSL